MFRGRAGNSFVGGREPSDDDQNVQFIRTIETNLNKNIERYISLDAFGNQDEDFKPSFNPQTNPSILICVEVVHMETWKV